MRAWRKCVVETADEECFFFSLVCWCQKNLTQLKLFRFFEGYTSLVSVINKIYVDHECSSLNLTKKNSHIFSGRKLHDRM